MADLLIKYQNPSYKQRYQNTKAQIKQQKVQLSSLRNKAERDITDNDKLKSALGATIGTVIPMALMMKKRGIKNPFKLEYNLKEMLILSTTSIFGAVGAGMIEEDKKTRINRINEGVFQFANATVPTVMVWAGLKLCNSVKSLNNIPAKVVTTIATLLAGMKLAAVSANKICDPKDLKPDRKHDLKVPFVERLNLDKLLPAIYAYCGYRAGKTN